MTSWLLPVASIEWAVALKCCADQVDIGVDEASAVNHVAGR
jgi:hypothetical protein